MKKLFLSCLLITVMCSPVLAGEGGTGLYLGAGGSWGIQNLNPYDPYNIGISYDDAWGVNFRIGGGINEHISIQADLDVYQGFEWNGNFWVWNTPLAASSEVSVVTIISSLKVSAPVADNLAFYFSPGFGYMVAGEDVSVSVPGLIFSEGFDLDGACARVACGGDISLNDSVGFFLEGGYVWGLGDLERVRYGTMTTGLLFTF